MSDASVAQALRSDARLVVIEAPAGCGKTYQGSHYARSTANGFDRERVLILAHTHAACDVFSDRTRGCSGRVEISTIDSLICQVASAYHFALDLPPDCGVWARRQKNGYALLAAKVNRLISRSNMIAATLAARFPVVICDEHQDASSDQHAIAAALHNAGSKLRIFGDPMQSIYLRTNSEMEGAEKRWDELKRSADAFEELDHPHRWSPNCEGLGNWILQARKTLRDGGQIDLSGNLPDGVSLIVAENQSRAPGGYAVADVPRRQIHNHVNKSSRILILTPHNDRVDALRALFGRRIPIWEGHIRHALSTLVDSLVVRPDDPEAAGKALSAFLPKVAVGCSAAALTNALLDEIRTGCVQSRRGKFAQIQKIAKAVLVEPNHRGIATALRLLFDLSKSDPAFARVKIDHSSEFWDAVRLAHFDNAVDGLAELSRRRSKVRPMPPNKAISTIHKAKGLECEHVLIMPCDRKHFGNTLAARRKLYVAISRAMSSVTFVVSKTQPTPLLKL